MVRFHHLLGEEKRELLQRWASDLQINGLSCSGTPGVVIFEGREDSVCEYLRRLRAQRWQTMEVRAQRRIWRRGGGDGSGEMESAAALSSMRHFPLGWSSSSSIYNIRHHHPPDEAEAEAEGTLRADAGGGGGGFLEVCGLRHVPGLLRECAAALARHRVHGGLDLCEWVQLVLGSGHSPQRCVTAALAAAHDNTEEEGEDRGGSRRGQGGASGRRMMPPVRYGVQEGIVPELLRRMSYSERRVIDQRRRGLRGHCVL